MMDNEWTSLITVMVASVFTVLATVIIHYEAIRLISGYVQHHTAKPRQQVIAVIIGVFAAHTVEVWLYALVFFALDTALHGAGIHGEFSGSILEYVYFSTVSYTSLGLGDLSPVGALRLLTGIEALNGLLLIAWSASFTYLVMEKNWKL